ncbi:toxin-antitoxin system YwqK family antitoxin [Brumimicrobium mesophilum]|uniref:toxin-antitoxin system YwqK family antitoxin n=1 Tax=Brumimicrobium mesophilum TaxID=392717 RepID=UPI000D142407|nr:toxin-antitoxin system YwqK family antitoxin [Brumimicrobium mesophilum]
MIKVAFTSLLIFTSAILFAQFDGVKRGPCFTKSVDRLGDEYAVWECDNRDAIVDCNEKLESEPGSNYVFNRENGEPYTGSCETCYPNGLRQMLINFRNGKAEGVDSTFYQSGCPQVVRNHIDGQENGSWTYFHDTSGLVAWNINYMYGQKEGKSIYFKQRKVGDEKYTFQLNGVERFVEYAVYENDTTKIEYYKKGLLDGVRKEFGPNSKIKIEAHYKAGVFDGSFIEYNSEGSILQERLYEMGNKVGEWKYYYNDGNLLRTESWEDNVKEGAFKTFYIQGHIQSLETYKKGMKHGKFMERFPDDKLKREAYYKKDELIENHVYDEYGNEIETFGADKAKNKTEDDAVPTTKSKKKWQFWK